MTSRGVWVLVASVIATACGETEGSKRDAVLAKLPAAADAVLVADGKALSHARLRPVVNALRPVVPAGFDCVVDAALTSESVAVAVSTEGVVVVLAGSVPSNCSALSRIAGGLAVATLGDATTGTGFAADDRVRPYLDAAPIALYASRDDVRVLAAAQAAPFSAWAAFDSATRADQLQLELGARVRVLEGLPAVAPFAKAMSISRRGSQVTVRLADVPNADIALAAAAVVTHTREQLATQSEAFPCPRAGVCKKTACQSAVTCAVERYSIEVSWITATRARLTAAPRSPVIVNARGHGVRIDADVPTIGLVRGDVITAVDGHRVTTPEEFVQFVRSDAFTMTLQVWRGRRFGTIEVVHKR